MNKKVLALFLFVIFFTVFHAVSFGQVSSYCFTQSSGTYSAISGGTAHTTTATDDVVYTAVPIGFTFNFNGTNYTTISVSTNGFITFGATAPANTGATTGFVPISATTAYAGAVSAMGRDLIGGAAGTLRSQTLGVGPSRTFVIQWGTWRRYITSAQADNLNFQIILYETSNRIDIIYGTNTASATAGTVQVGLRGASNADFKNRSTAPWASTVAGGVNTASVNTNNTTVPASGLTFTYSPIPSAPSVTPGSRCGTGTVGLSASGAGAGEDYKWYDALTGGTLLQTGGSGYTTPSISATTTYYVTKYNTATLCESTPRTAVIATVNNIPAQPSAITGSAAPCSGGSQAYSVTDLGITYNWTFPTGGAPLWSQSGGGTTGSITASVGSASGNITVTPSNVCGTGPAQTLAVTPGAGPVVSVTPNPASSCGGAGVVITASGSGSYNWSPATGLSATNIANPTATPAVTTVYTVTEGASGCNNQATVTVKVGGTVTPAPVAAPTSVCPGGTVNLTSTPTEGAYYLINPTGDGGFETGTTPAANGWTTVNTSGAVGWFCGAAATIPSGGGVRTAYFSNNTGTANAYNTGTSATSHIYRSVTVPAGATSVNLSFVLKSRGEQTNWDQLLVSRGTAAIATTSPTGTNTVPTGYTSIFIQNSTTTWTAYQTVTVNNLPVAGTTFNLVFTWKNDNAAGTQPPASIDNISLTYVPAAAPTFSYAWTSTPVGFTSTSQNPTANPVVATTYNLTVTENTTGCTGSASTANVAMYPLPQGSLSGSTICAGSPGLLTWTSSAGTGPFTVNYNPSAQSNAGVVSATAFNTNIAPGGTTAYTVTSVTDANGCVRNSGITGPNATITVNSAPTVPTVTNNSRCNPGTVVLTAGGAGAGEGYRWYSALTGGSLLYTGNPFTTPSISVSTTYYVVKYQTASPFCESSPRIPITASIFAGGLDNYTVTRTTGITYTDISGTGTAVTSWKNGTDSDDNMSNAVAIPFDFYFDGGVQRQVLISNNGFVTFNTSTKADGGDLAACGTPEPYTWQNDNFTVVGRLGSSQVVAPFYNDLLCRNALNASMYYQTTGVAPNRIFVVQWKGVYNDWYDNSSSPDFCNESAGNLNFQAWLYETSGNIEFYYSTMTQTNPVSGSNCSYSLDNDYTSGLNSSTMSASPTAAQLFTQQTANTATFGNTAQNNLTTLPTANSKITFTRSAPAAPTAVPSTLCAIVDNYPANGETNQCLNQILSWSPGDGSPTSYDVYFGTAASPPFLANVTHTYYDPGNLAMLTTYYWKILPRNSFGAAATGTVYSFTTGQGDVQATEILCNVGTQISHVANGFNSLGQQVYTNTYEVCSSDYSGTLTSVNQVLSSGTELDWTMAIPWLGINCTNAIPATVWGNCAGITQSPLIDFFGWFFTIFNGGNTYYDVFTRGCNANGACTRVILHWNGDNNSAPTNLTANPVSPCSGASTTLTATGGTMGAGANYQWYTGSCGGTLIATTTTNTLVVTPVANITYYVRRTGGTGYCPNTTACESLAIIVNAAPASSAANRIVCTGMAAITMTGATATPAASVVSATWTGGAGLGAWTQNANPALATFTPSQPYGTFTATLTVTYNCGAVPIISTCLMIWADGTVAYKTWYGVIDNDWFKAGNWCNGIPTSTIDAFIPPGMPNLPVTIAGAGAACKTLTVSATASLTTSGTNNLDMYGDWINNGTYNYNTGTITFMGAAPQSVGGSAGQTFYNLTVNNNGTSGNDRVSLSQPATVNGTLTLTDAYLVSTATNLLTLSSTASATSGNANSFVEGPVKKIGDVAFIFPTGDDVAPAGSGTEDRWGRIGISDPGTTATDEYTAEFIYHNPTIDGYNTTAVMAPIIDVSTIEYWILNRTVTGSPNVSVVLYTENATTSGINDCPDLVVAHWNSGTSSWDDKGQLGISSVGGCPTPSPANLPLNITSTVTNTFSPFTFGSKSGVLNPLPVELLSFNVTCVDATVTANWTTASESNNDFFTLERSTDGTNFAFIKNIPGSGNSSSVKYYSTSDEDVLPGTSYYRLTQTDFNGNKVVFNPAIVNCTDDQPFSLSVSSAVSDDENIFISITGAPDGNILLVFRDVLGNELYTKAFVNNSGSVSFNLDIKSKLSSGVYFVIASSNENYVSRKIIIR